MGKKEMRTAIIVLLAALVVVLILLRLFNVFPPPDQTAGTIGDVEKVDRFRGQQMRMEDIKCDDPEVAKFIQGAEFQNLLKDENFRALLANPDQIKYIVLALDVSQVFDQAAQNFSNFLEQGDNAKLWFESAEFQQFQQNFSQLLPSDAPEIISPNAQDIQKLLFNSDFQSLIMNFNFKAVYNQDIQGIFGADFSKLLGGTFQTIRPGDDAPTSIDFNNTEFQVIILSQDFQKFIFLNQDIQKLVMNQDFHKIFMSQDFEQFVRSAEFQNAIKNSEVNKVW
ncbi:MAG: hypothetical protein KAU06_08000 [Candidatus Marinimicrobia bacterium]|nr:hypothetical protein [Candidatus Neomarinimicrobiota bacterium]